MNGDRRDRIRELEERLRLVEEENASLTGQTEDVLLLGLLAEALGNCTDADSVFATLLERVSILKGIGYCAFGRLREGAVEVARAYAAFLDDAGPSGTWSVPPEAAATLREGRVVAAVPGGGTVAGGPVFAGANFVPRGLLLVPCGSRECADGVLVLADETRDAEALTDLAPLLQQAMHMATGRLDNLALLHELERLNAELERQVQARTAMLMATNARLEREIVERRRVDEELRQSATVFENTSDGVMITDAEVRILAVNRAFVELTGYGADEIRGQTPRVLQSGRHGRSFYEAMWASVRERGRWHGEIWNRRKNGEVYPELLSISVVRDEAGRITNYVGVFSDISALKESEARFEHLAHHDPLTGLPNRLLFNARVEHAVARAQRTGDRMAVLFLDLDRFKDVNDSFGHPAGDELLREVARRLTACVRSDDTVARLGGDEFTILLEDLPDRETAGVVAAKSMQGLSAPFVVQGFEVYVTACIGISLFPEDGRDATTLLKHADSAMYRAKEEGRSSYGFYTAELTESTVERFILENSLRRAIQQGELVLHFQPQVSLLTGRIVGLEALVRWQHPEAGLIPPGRFVPLAEDSGLIEAVGSWVLHAACEQAAAWREAGLPAVRIAVNLSSRQVGDAGLTDAVRGALEETRLEPRWLELEITESVVMRHPEQAAQTLAALKSLGLSLAIDDFGKGYSSLGYLRRFPFDTLKIDRSFLKDIPSQRGDEAIARAVIALGHGLGLQLVAEGIETAEQVAFLEDHGCDAYQGNFFSPPLTAPECARLLVETQGAGR